MRLFVFEIFIEKEFVFSWLIFIFMHLLYLDPGSSSYLIQAIAAGALGAVFFIKSFWYIIKAFFTGKKKGMDEFDKKEEL